MTKEEIKNMMECLPTANSGEIKNLVNALCHTIYFLEETIKAKNITIESLEHTIKSDDRIETLKEIIKSKDDRIETLKETIDLLENQSSQCEFEKLFKGKFIGEA